MTEPAARFYVEEGEVGSEEYGGWFAAAVKDADGSPVAWVKTLEIARFVAAALNDGQNEQYVEFDYSPMVAEAIRLRSAQLAEQYRENAALISRLKAKAA